jgi:hypothetical protein
LRDRSARLKGFWIKAVPTCSASAPAIVSILYPLEMRILTSGLNPLSWTLDEFFQPLIGELDILRMNQLRSTLADPLRGRPAEIFFKGRVDRENGAVRGHFIDNVIDVIENQAQFFFVQTQVVWAGGRVGVGWTSRFKIPGSWLGWLVWIFHGFTSKAGKPLSGLQSMNSRHAGW